MYLGFPVCTSVREFGRAAYVGSLPFRPGSGPRTPGHPILERRQAEEHPDKDGSRDIFSCRACLNRI